MDRIVLEKKQIKMCFLPNADFEKYFSPIQAFVSPKQEGGVSVFPPYYCLVVLLLDRGRLTMPLLLFS